MSYDYDRSRSLSIAMLMDTARARRRPGRALLRSTRDAYSQSRQDGTDGVHGFRLSLACARSAGTTEAESAAQCGDSLALRSSGLRRVGTRRDAPLCPAAVAA